MKRTLIVGTLCLFTALSLGAQGRGRGHSSPAPMRNPNPSNAPAGTRNASPDRDFGRDRAADVGRGQQKGLDKTPSAGQKSHKAKVKKNKKGNTPAAKS